MLQITNLHANVGDKPILKGLTLSLNPGEIHAIMGPNGAGKSTLGYVLSGRPGYEVTEGEVGSRLRPKPLVLSLSKHPRPADQCALRQAQANYGEIYSDPRTP